MLSLNDREWIEIEIGTLFDIKRGNAKNVINKTSGKTALITAIDSKNGLSACIVEDKNEHIYKRVYTVNNNGNGVCLAYWHNYSFVCSSDVTVLTPKYDNLCNQHIAHFIITMIRGQKAKFNYGYKMSNDRMRKQKIMLPVTDDGKPDYDFMEQYIKEREDKLKQKYIEFK